MSRIVAGKFGGRILQVPAKGTRPTSERVREAVFSSLEHWDAVAGANVLDLFAGSGALGLEAISRGARRVTLVESAKGAHQVARANASSLGLTDAQVVLGKAERFVATVPDEPWDLVFLDPPYDLSGTVLDELLAALADKTVPGAVIAVERDKHAAAPVWPQPWRDLATKTYGSTVVYYAEHPSGD